MKPARRGTLRDRLAALQMLTYYQFLTFTLESLSDLQPPPWQLRAHRLSSLPRKRPLGKHVPNSEHMPNCMPWSWDPEPPQLRR